MIRREGDGRSYWNNGCWAEASSCWWLCAVMHCSEHTPEMVPKQERGKATTMEEKQTPTLVNIGGRRLALKTAGEGVPTVVLEMGLGSTSSPYDAIAGQIAAWTRVVWYDRAGLGQSDPAPIPRTIQDLVLDLHTLLQKAALPGALPHLKSAFATSSNPLPSKSMQVAQA